MRHLVHALIITASATSLTACAFDELDEAREAETDLHAPSTDDATDEVTSTETQESVAEGYVAGAGDVTDDFGDEGLVDRNNHRRSMATGLWQMILWADEAIESDGSTFDLADVDCDFGPNTEAATRSWQRSHGISDVDGSVGRGTFSRADDNLVIFGSEGPSSKVFYAGSNGFFDMLRLGDPATPRHAYQAIGTDGARRVVRYSTAGCNSSMWLGLL